MKKWPFVIMGMLDCVTCLLLTFAAVYLPGSLLILLPQAAIPISMGLSTRIKGERYAKYQYLGATVVVLGILVVLEPLVTQRHVADFVCEAYDQEEFCALCEGEMNEEGCLSHRTKGDGLQSGLGESILSVQHNTSAYDHDGELCRWIPTESAQSSSSSGSTTTILLWSIVTILACIPMALSSIYKEISLSGSENIDPIFLNGVSAVLPIFILH